ncbi:hypothetical protein KI655_24030 [Vibrio sp. D404a]|uniref:hypothetical protein n=1 Tax=unclassified Vibrio TaxID=2614977 RepID=UPI0025561713|nr:MULTISPECIES: hypothetical protein [unclassified Vibrio]MDK9740344.1 hypothetical protein [Vibrio sp. D404a]MDK9799908.1 hypothetical protein [Vibrio sp. D449a]
MIYEPKVVIIKSPYKSDRSTIVDEVKLSDNGLDIIVESKDWRVKVNFDATWGFRVLDEGDLGEFWSKCNLTQGWCFEVLEGGWNSLEKTRDHYVTGKLNEPHEYLIIGLNECVSVLAHEPPVITELASSNKSLK